MATKQPRLTPYGRKVRKKLIDKNMTQVELAALLGCNKQYIHCNLTEYLTKRTF